METNVTIPQKNVNQKVIQFRFKPGVLSATVIMEVAGEQKSETVDFSNLVSGATPTQKTTLKQFFKRVAALALDSLNENDGVDVVEGDVINEIFD
jgi:hypothetical protein